MADLIDALRPVVREAAVPRDRPLLDLGVGARPALVTLGAAHAAMACLRMLKAVADDGVRCQEQH